MQTMKSNIYRTLFCTLLLVMSGFAAADAQSAKVNEMRKKADNLRAEIKKQEKILLSTQDDINSQLRNISVIGERIVKQEQLVGVIKEEVAAINKDIDQINSDIAIQEARVEKSKAEYAEALRRARKFGKSKNKLHFIMSADDFNTMMRRYRYANTYMDAHGRLAKSLQAQIDILSEKNRELELTRLQLNASLAEQEKVAAELKSMRAEQQKIVDKLKSQQSKIRKQIKQKQKELDRQNRRIEEEIERILREEEAERKRKAAEEARKKAASKNKKESASGSKSKKKDAYIAESGVAELSGSFAVNKKKMPVPITGSYIVAERYGSHNVIGTNGVKLKSSGVVFEGTTGAKARCVFKGEVQRVIDEGNYHFILVRHGDYITVYCDIANPCVKKGDKVEAGDILGDVGIDPKHNVPRMQFQIRKGRSILDPAQWLKM